MIVVILEAQDKLVLFVNSDTPFAREKGATLMGLLEFGACLKKMVYKETDSIDWLGLIKRPFYGTQRRLNQ